MIWRLIFQIYASFQGRRRAPLKLVDLLRKATPLVSASKDESSPHAFPVTFMTLLPANEGIWADAIAARNVAETVARRKAMFFG